MPEAPGRPRKGAIKSPARTVPWALGVSRLTSGRYFPVPSECLERVPWLQAVGEEGLGLFYWLDEPGRAQVVRASDIVEMRNAALDGDNRRLAQDVWLTVHEGAFVSSGNLTIPKAVVAHVTGDPLEQTPLWICAREGDVELWGERVLRREVGDAHERTRRDGSLFSKPGGD